MEFFVTRHSTKPREEDLESTIYPGISENGVELAKKRAEDIFNLIENAPEGSIIPLVGVSPMERTRSTMKVYSEELRKKIERKENIIFIPREEIQKLYKEEKGVHKTIEKIKEKVRENPEAKVVIEYPLMLKALSDDKWWALEDKDKPQEKRKLGPYIGHLGGIERFRRQRDKAIRRWFDEKGIVKGKQIGPNPIEIAERHLKTFKKLERFVRKIFPQKPLLIGVVGHSLEMDAFFTYLANNGDITSDGFEKIGGKEIKETERAKLILTPDGGIELKYRGQDFQYNPQNKYDESNK